MAKQFSGSNAKISYKPEKDNGVLVTTLANKGQTTLDGAVDPGGSTMVVADMANLAAGNIIAVGAKNNQEIVKIKSVKAAQKELTLEATTKLNFRHGEGEAVKKLDKADGFFNPGSVVTITPRSDRPLDNSQALGGGVRGLSNALPGRYEFGADMTLELDIRVAPFWLLHALNDNYISVGTAVNPEVATTLGAAAAAGAEELTLASIANLAADDFIEIGGKEVVKLKAAVNAGRKITFSDSAPMGLRYAHANGAAVKKVVAPFTHTIKKGSRLPAGISLLLALEESDQESLVLLTGCRVNTLSLTVEGGTTIPTLTVNMVAARGQVLAENLFGDPTKVPHTPYAQWELEVSAGDADNRLNSFTFEIQNNISAAAPLGTPLPGAITAGEGSITGSFEYEYRTQAFSFATAVGEVRELVLTWNKIGDANHALKIKLPAAKFGGPAHPGVESKDPIDDTKSFSAIIDSVTNTDIEVVAKTENPSVEYLTE